MLVLRRLSTKTTPVQTPVLELDDFSQAEDPMARRRIYLVTFPHPRSPTSADGLPLRVPESFTQQGLGDAIRAACLEPDYLDYKSRQQGSAVDLERLGIFFEWHKEDDDGQLHRHAHGTFLASSPVALIPLSSSSASWSPF